MSAEQKMVTIPQFEFDRLVEDSNWLGSLEAAGVDNWGGMEEAQRIHREWLKEQGLEDE